MIPGVTVAVFFKGEADHLARDVPSWLPFCEELVFVDTGESLDARAALMKALGDPMGHDFDWPRAPEVLVLPTPVGCKGVFSCSPWRDDFAFHYNEAASLARTPWVIAIDADEELAGDPAALEDCLAQNDGALITVMRFHDTGSSWESDNNISLTRVWQPKAGWRQRFRVHSLFAPPPGGGPVVSVHPDILRIYYHQSDVRVGSLGRTVRIAVEELSRADPLDPDEYDHYQAVLAWASNLST